jgi:HK97 family phage major capsid protein
MKTTPKLIYSFSKYLFERANAGQVSNATEDEFLEWGNGELQSCVSADTPMDLPPQFHGIWREFTRSKGFDPDINDLVLMAEQMANPGPFKPPGNRNTTMKSSSPAGSWEPTVSSDKSRSDAYQACLARINQQREAGQISDEQYRIQKEQLDALYGVPTPDSKKGFLSHFDQLTGVTKRKFENIEFARRTGDLMGIARASASAFAELSLERRHSGLDPIRKMLDDPEIAEKVGMLVRYILTKPRLRGPNGMEKAFSQGLSPSDGGLGTGFAVAADVSTSLLYATYEYSAYKTAATFRILRGLQMSFPKLTQSALAVFITPGSQGQTQLQADVNITGADVNEAPNTIGLLIEIATELVNDARVSLEEAVMRAFVQGLGRAIDYALYQGSGANDQVSGAQTGIFVSQAVKTSVAPLNGTSVAALHREDFIGAIAAIDPSGLTWNPRWSISPAFLPKLLMLRDGQGPQYILKTPSETGGEFEICGFPVTWAAQAPGLDAPSQKIAAFGAPGGWLVALHEDFELMASDVSQLVRNVRQMRLINRGRVDAHHAPWFSTLQLSAQ